MVEALGNGTYRVSDGTTQWVLYAVGPPEARWVFFNGRVYVIDIQGSRKATPQRSAHDGDMALASPMPATVASVHVTPGQDVLEGDLLVMLEAMKMELPIKAPRDGRIKAIRCKAGELVQPAVQLVEFE